MILNYTHKNVRSPATVNDARNTRCDVIIARAKRAARQRLILFYFKNGINYSDWKQRLSSLILLPKCRVRVKKLLSVNKNTFGPQSYAHARHFIATSSPANVCTSFCYEKARYEVKCYNLMLMWSSYDVPISRVTRDERKEKEEVPTCRFTKTALFNGIHVVCTYL